MFTKQTHVYKEAAGCDIRADVYRSPDRVVCPAILWLHGGALIFGDRDTLLPEQRARYLQAGYAVVSVDYRLAPEVKLEAIIEDLRDAYAWLRLEGPDLFHIDPERIAVIGHSAGGYLTLMAGFCVYPRPKALVSFYGYGDITGEWYRCPDPFYCQEPTVSKEDAYRAIGDQVITGTPFEGELFEARYRFYLYCRQRGLWPKEVTGHDPHEDLDWFTPYCSLHNVAGHSTERYPPTLLIHGDQDTDVPFEQSVLMSRALARQGIDHELIRMRGLGHGFDHDGSSPVVSKVFDRLLAFLKKQVFR